MINRETWDEVYSSNAWGRYPSLPLIRFMARNFYKVDPRSSVKILELGCGPGPNLWYLVKEGFVAYGIDFSRVACNAALVRLKLEGFEENSNYSIYCGDYGGILGQFDDNFFDAIIDIESLYCNTFADTKSIYEAAVQKLKKGGFFFSQTFNKKTWGFDEMRELSHHGGFPTEGPMSGKGFSRYTTKDDIFEIFDGELSRVKEVELQELHLNNGKVISEWLIEVVKN